MLDLKAKLAAAGLVTQEDIDRADDKKKKNKKARDGGRRGRGKGGKEGMPLGVGRGASRADGGEVARLPVAELRDGSKGQQYDAVRRFVQQVRVDDPGRPPSEQASTFHFPTATGQVGRLVVEPAVRSRLTAGELGIVAYMSNHGLAHAVVPARAARAIAELFPRWLRVLEGHPQAGRIETEVPTEASDSTAS